MVDALAHEPGGIGAVVDVVCRERLIEVTVTQKYGLGEKLIEVGAATEAHSEFARPVTWCCGNYVMLGTVDGGLRCSPLEIGGQICLGGRRGSKEHRRIKGR